MGKSPPACRDVDAYLAQFAPEVRARLQKIRATIRRAAPRAVESIGYGIAAYKLDGPLIYFAGFKAHIGLYPMTVGVKAAFAEQLAIYPGSTGTVRFPHDRPVPYGLIGKIARFRVAENAARAAAKAARRKPTVKRASQPKIQPARPRRRTRKST